MNKQAVLSQQIAVNSVFTVRYFCPLQKTTAKTERIGLWNTMLLIRSLEHHGYQQVAITNAELRSIQQ
tara:strand:- start:605 stop:808 length:204 start_codon:yes stop_codon:yes gene_type:complete